MNESISTFVFTFVVMIGFFAVLVLGNFPYTHVPLPIPTPIPTPVFFLYLKEGRSSYGILIVVSRYSLNGIGEVTIYRDDVLYPSILKNEVGLISITFFKNTVAWIRVRSMSEVPSE